MTYTIKLVDFETKFYDTTFGTCDLCLSTGEHREEIFVFQVSGGRTIELENGYWCYGDYFTLFEIDNTADFAHWLSSQKFHGKRPENEDELGEIITRAVEDYDLYLVDRTYREELGFYIYGIELHTSFHPDENLEEITRSQADSVYHKFLHNVSEIDGAEVISVKLSNQYRNAIMPTSGRVDADSPAWSIVFYCYELAAQNIYALEQIIYTYLDTIKKIQNAWGVIPGKLRIDFVEDGVDKKITIGEKEYQEFLDGGAYPELKTWTVVKQGRHKS